RFFQICAPPPLSSFPTRRSSDLLRAAHDSGGFGHVQLLPVTHDESLALTSRQSRELLLNNFKHLSSLQLLCRRFLHVGPVGGLQNRKSTRLNSSHDQISYAVFCL